jgi:hypothetical protein
MARLRQSGGASGVRKVSHSLWERAGARAGNGAGALFASLDAQDAQEQAGAAGAGPTQPREQAALTLEHLAAQIRAGAWSVEIAALVAAASAAISTQPSELHGEPHGEAPGAPSRRDERRG